MIAPLIAALPFMTSTVARFAAFAIYVIAAISDYFDGMLARTRGLVTDLGRLLDPLADNGGFTLTHAIKPTSPAIDTGSNPIPLAFDQTGYVRKEGVETDIGAFEWRTGTGQERVFVGGFDGLCDQ